LWQLDASNSKEIQHFARQARLLFGPPVDLIVASGTVISKPIDKNRWQDFDTLYRDNLRLALITCKQFFNDCDKSPNVRKNIILLTSNAGMVARPQQVAYACMKAAVISLVRSLAAAWGRFGIRVNGVAPGSVIVSRNRRALKKQFPDFPFDVARPSGKLAEPEDVASTVRFLLSHEHNQITGHVVVVDGGSSLQVRP
jgi:NAD(P)-dependent dehydrogenase (short-subunit alcohol dehydrogenase family)